MGLTISQARAHHNHWCARHLCVVAVLLVLVRRQLRNPNVLDVLMGTLTRAWNSWCGRA